MRKVTFVSNKNGFQNLIITKDVPDTCDFGKGKKFIFDDKEFEADIVIEFKVIDVEYGINDIVVHVEECDQLQVVRF